MKEVRKKTIKESSLVCINKGDKLLFEDGRECTLLDIKFSPNGGENSGVVALLFVKTDTSILEATSDRFRALPDFEYEEWSPSIDLNQFIDLIKEK